MKDFHHPNVLGLLGVVFDSPDGVPYLVLPFMELGNLKDYLKSKRVHVTNFDTLPKVIKTGWVGFCNPKLVGFISHDILHVVSIVPT